MRKAEGPQAPRRMRYASAPSVRGSFLATT